MRPIRTDLAVEAHEIAQERDRAAPLGVNLDTMEEEGIKVTRVEVTSPEGEKAIGKPVGNYITLDIADVANRDLEYGERVSKHLSIEIKRLFSFNDNSTILIVGLGNRNVTADAIGPKVVEKIMVTRHIFEFVPEQVDDRMRPVCVIAPGVLGITGIETGEVVRGIVDNVKPDLIIAIDALASRKTERIGTTIQVADTGIIPGSGVDNKRMGLTEQTLGVPTIAIGVPTVVYAHTIGRDSIEMLIQEYTARAAAKTEFSEMLRNISEQRLDGLVDKVLDEGLGDLVVTPKEVDMIIDDIVRIIADGLNLAVNKGLTLNDVNRFLH